MSQKVCKNKYCEQFPYAGDFCEAHDEQMRSDIKKRDGGKLLLGSRLVDGQPITNSELRGLFENLNEYYHLISPTLQANTQLANKIPLELARNAQQWCLKLAQDIWRQEIKHRENVGINICIDNDSHLWSRLAELEIYKLK
jgi:hypothetical protein